MKFKGTKGKWKLNPNGGSVDNSYNSCILDENDNTICNVFYTHDETLSNALLISKAPEMLELLELLYSKIDFSWEVWGSDEGQELASKTEQLIKEATEL